MQLEDVQWTAGVIDGDGCVRIHQGQLRVDVKQAKHGWEMLEKLKSLWGGLINKRQPDLEYPHRQQKAVWSLSGRKAEGFCLVIVNEVRLKRPQLEVALQSKRMRGNWQRAVIIDTMGTEYRGDSIKAAREKAGLVPRNYSHLPTGWTCSSRKSTTSRQQAKEELQRLKKVPHPAILESLPHPYTAGFLDADGCITQRNGAIVMSAAQKYPSITTALKATYGGCFCQRISLPHSEWCIQSKAAKEMILKLLPFFVNKKHQAQLAFDCNKSNFADIDRQLKAAKRPL